MVSISRTSDRNKLSSQPSIGLTSTTVNMIRSQGHLIYWPSSVKTNLFEGDCSNLEGEKLLATASVQMILDVTQLRVGREKFVYTEAKETRESVTFGEFQIVQIWGDEKVSGNDELHRKRGSHEELCWPC